MPCVTLADGSNFQRACAGAHPAGASISAGMGERGPDRPDGPDDSSSTLVATGKAALTFTEMGAFVRDIEARPLARLISDLEGLFALPDAKYQLVVMVLRRKLRGGPGSSAILIRVKGLSGSANPEVRKRAEQFLAKPAD
jgi:hypothetical protein